MTATRIALLLAALLAGACSHTPEPRFDAGLPAPLEFPHAGTAYVPAPDPGALGGLPDEGEAPFAEEATAVAHEAPVTSPPAVGRESLLALGDRSVPRQYASLNLAEEGRRLRTAGDSVKARARLQSALQVWGNNPLARYYLGLLEFEAGQYAQAAAFARVAARGLRAWPYWQARAHLLVAESEARLGEAGQAEAARRRALELDPFVSLED